MCQAAKHPLLPVGEPGSALLPSVSCLFDMFVVSVSIVPLFDTREEFVSSASGLQAWQACEAKRKLKSHKLHQTTAEPQPQAKQRPGTKYCRQHPQESSQQAWLKQTNMPMQDVCWAQALGTTFDRAAEASTATLINTLQPWHFVRISILRNSPDCKSRNLVFRLCKITGVRQAENEPLPTKTIAHAAEAA